MPLGNEEQTMLREMAHNWAQRNAPVGEFRAMRDADNERGFDANTFAAVAEMGWTGAVIDEDYGGSNVGFVGMGAVLEELGRTLVAVPLIGSAVGTATAIGLGGTEQQKSLWLPRNCGWRSDWCAGDRRIGPACATPHELRCQQGWNGLHFVRHEDLGA